MATFLTSNRDRLIAVLLFACAWVAYVQSPVSIPIDSHYSMLLSHQILKRGSFALDEYFKPPLDARYYIGLRSPWISDSPYPYHIYQHEGHLYYYFPPGSSLLSIPFVAIFEAMGKTMLTDSGSYDPSLERYIERRIAAIVTAATLVLIFFLARTRLDVMRSLALALVAGFGSALWTTASRAMWSHTWGVFLLSLTILALARDPPWLNSPRGGFAIGTLLAWLYLTRPAFIGSIGCVGLFMLWANPRARVALVAAAVVWGLGFIAYSETVSGEWFAPYYRGGASLSLANALPGLALHLISPARGLLIYTPALFCVIYLVARHVDELRRMPLFLLAAAGTAAHLALLAFFPSTGDYAYGSRLTTDLLPWLVLIAVLAWGEAAGMRHAGFGAAARRAACAVLIAFGFFIHARGAFAMSTQIWNVFPCDIGTCRERYWDWRHPQFAAGLEPWPSDKKPPKIRIYHGH